MSKLELLSRKRHYETGRLQSTKSYICHIWCPRNNCLSTPSGSSFGENGIFLLFFTTQANNMERESSSSSSSSSLASSRVEEEEHGNGCNPRLVSDIDEQVAVVVNCTLGDMNSLKEQIFCLFGLNTELEEKESFAEPHEDGVIMDKSEEEMSPMGETAAEINDISVLKSDGEGQTEKCKKEKKLFRIIRRVFRKKVIVNDDDKKNIMDKEQESTKDEQIDIIIYKVKESPNEDDKMPTTKRDIIRQTRISVVDSKNIQETAETPEKTQAKVVMEDAIVVFKEEQNDDSDDATELSDETVENHDELYHLFHSIPLITTTKEDNSALRSWSLWKNPKRNLTRKKNVLL
jgi:hypothetical protein